MKNQIDQSTPFLAFYDLLRIRGIYSTEEKREKLRRGFRRAMALAAVFFGMAPTAWAEWSGLPVPSDSSVRTWADSADERAITLDGSSYTWDDFRIGANHEVSFSAGTAINKVPNGPQSVISGTLRGNNVWILNPSGLVINGGATIEVSGLLAAAMSDDKVSSFHLTDIGNGSIDLGGKGGSSYTVAIGKTLSGLPSNALVVNTTGMTGDGTISVAPSGGKITFNGITLGNGSVAKAGDVEFDTTSGMSDGSSVTADANVGGINNETGVMTAGSGTGSILGMLNQSGGSATAGRIAALNQTAAGAVANTAEITGVANQTAGTIDTGAATTLSVGAGSTLGAGSVTAGTVSVGSGSGALTLTGNTLNGKTINAGAVTLAGAENQAYNVSGNISSLQTGANAAGDVTANKTGTGTLTLNSINANSLTLQSAATASGNISANTISATTLTQGSGTITTKEITGTVVQNAGTIQAVNAADGLKLNNTITTQNGTLSGSGGNVTVANGSTLSGMVNANTLNGDFTQSAGSTINATTVAGTVTQNGGTIQANNSTDGLTLSKAITTQNGTLSGNGGNVTIANGSTLSGTVNADTLNGNFTQSAGSTINATTVAGTVTQNGGTIQANNSTDGLTLSKAITTQNGTLSGNGGDITLAGGDMLSGTVSAKNLSAGTGNITQSAGTITVEETLTAGTFTQGGDAATTASAATIAANVEQTGAGTITATTAIGADGNAKTVAQSGTGLIKTDHVYGTVSQTGSGAARLQANTASGTLVFEGDVTQNNANATIGTTDTDITVKNAAFKQQDNTKGKVEAHTLTLDNAAKDKVYDFYGEGNQIDTITGTAGSVGINNGEHDLTLKDLSTSADIAVTGAEDVTLDGVSSSSGKVRVLSATGKVSDTSAQGAVTLELGRRDAGSNVRTVGSVNLVNGTGAITIQGVNAAGNVVIANNAVTLANSGGGAESKGNIYADGDVGISAATFTQNGKTISGNNVTLLGTGVNGITVGGNVTATDGDILVKSANGKVETGVQTLQASKNIVLQGNTGVETSGTTFQAATTGTAGTAGVGINATGDGKNVVIGANTKMTAQTVVLKADKGDVSIATDGTVAMDASADPGGAKKANLVVFAGGADGSGGTFTADLGANKPSSNITIAKAATAPVNSGDTVDLDTFAYKTAAAGGMEITFKGSNIALENTAGSVTVNTTRDITIINAAGGSGSGSIAAANVVDPSDSPVTVGAGADANSSPVGLVGTSVTLNTSNGTVVTEAGKAAGKVTVAGGATLAATGGDLSITTKNNKNIVIEDGAIVQSQTGDVTLTSGGAMVADGRIVSGTVTVGENQTVMNGTATPVGAVTLSANKYVNVGATGKIEGKGDVGITSTTGNINFLGTADSTEGKVAMSAEADGKSVKIGDAGSASEPVSPAVAATVRASTDVALAGGKAVLALGGSSVTAGGKISTTAQEYIALDATLTGKDDVKLETTTKETMTSAVGEYAAGSPAGILVQGGTVESTEKAVAMTSAGSILVGNGVIVTAKTTLDMTAKGESKPATETTLAIVQGVRLAGTVSAEGKGTVTAEKGSIEQTGGSLSVAALDLKARDIDQTDGSVTATGAATAEATAGSVILGQAGNAFQSTLAVTASDEVNVRDADALDVSVAGATKGNVRLQAGTTLDVTSDIDAGDASDATTIKTATLISGAQMNAKAVKATGAVTATADTGGATFAGDVEGSSATLTALGGGALQAQNVTANGGDATLTGNAVQANGAVTASGNVALIGGAGGATARSGVTAGGNAVVIADGGAATVNGNIQAANVGLQGATVANNGTISGVNQLAIVQTGNAALTLNQDEIPAGAQTVGIQSAGNLTVTSPNALAFGNASVAAGGRTVAANGLASTAGTVAVSAGGNIASSAITGAAGTTVTTQNGGAINVAGNLGQGGDTVVNANGAAVNAGTLASGGLLDVNNGGAVNANIAAGGDANIQAASLQAGNTQTGGNLVLQVGGDANVGQVAVGGDVNGAVGGVYTVAGGNVGTMGQGGDFTTGQFTLEGDLASGDITMDAGTLQMDGNLDAGGAAVDITAGGGIQGGGVLTAGQLSLAGGAIGAAGNNFQVVTPALQNITGSTVYLVDTQAGTVTVGTIQATGNTLTLQFDNATQINAAGGIGISSGGDINLTVNAGQFGSLDNPIRVTVPGTFTIDGTSPELLHIVVNGDAVASDLVVNYLSAGFAIYGSRDAGWQIIGLGPEKQRLINRALAFTVNTPELKSKQGIFGDPAFIHTRMNVSEARAAANMDMLALNAVDFYDTWEHVQSGEGRRALRKWAPKVDMGPNSLLSAKLAAQASEMETQPEVWVPGQTGASSPAPAAPTAPAAPAAE